LRRRRFNSDDKIQASPNKPTLPRDDLRSETVERQENQTRVSAPLFRTKPDSSECNI
jgi:hypothetical protein